MKNKPKSHRQHKRRSLIDFTKARTGNIATGNITGGDYNAGIDPGAVLIILSDALADDRHNRKLLVTAIEQLQEKIEASYEALSQQITLVAIIALVVWAAGVAILVLVFVRQ